MFGPAMGRPKSAVFRTADVVGLDTLMHVTPNCSDALPDDERRDVFDPPPRAHRAGRQEVAGRRRPSRASTRRSATTSCSSISRRWSTARTRSRASIRFGAARGRRRRRREDAPHRRRRRSRLRARAHRPLRNARSTRRTAWARSPTASSTSTARCAGASAGSAGRSRPGTRSASRPPPPRWRPPATPSPAGCASRSPRRAKGCSFYTADRPGKRAQLGMRGGFTPVAENPRHLSLDAVRARAAARSSATAAPRSSISATASSASSTTRKMNAIDPDIVAMTMKAVDRAEREGVGAGDRQRRARRLLRRRQPVRADGRARPGEHAGHRRHGGRLPGRLRAHPLRARPGGRRRRSA